VNDGTSVTPAESSTLAASGPTSGASRITPSPSRSHWISAPPMNTLPSSAHRVADSPIRQAAVVSSRASLEIRFSPDWTSRKQPVP
jgi:hypothetical protein